MAHLLVTGFGPFPSMPRNPSGPLARRVAALPRWRLAGVAPEALILTTSYAALASELDPALAAKPAAVLMIGVAGRSKRVRVEWRATSRRSTLFPDVAGQRAAVPTAPVAARRCPMAPAKLLRALRRHAVPARLSRDAGRYLCNATYFRALGRGIPVVFIHIPKGAIPAPPGVGRITRPFEARLAAALGEIGTILLSEARRSR